MGIYRHVSKFQSVFSARYVLENEVLLIMVVSLEVYHRTGLNYWWGYALRIWPVMRLRLWIQMLHKMKPQDGWWHNWKKYPCMWKNYVVHLIQQRIYLSCRFISLFGFHTNLVTIHAKPQILTWHIKPDCIGFSYCFHQLLQLAHWFWFLFASYLFGFT